MDDPSNKWGARLRMALQYFSHISIAVTHIRKGVARITTRSYQKPASLESSLGPLGGRTKDEQRRRASLLQDLHRDYWIEAEEGAGHLAHSPTSLPEWWVNERLEARGESWRVQSVDGFRYEVYDIVACGDQKGSESWLGFAKQRPEIR